MNPEDLTTATKETDPQSAAFANITGADRGRVAVAAFAIIALGIEFGSGLGVWLVFGHGGSSRREPGGALVPTMAAPALPSPEPVEGIETPSDVIERFFLECVRPALGQRVSAAMMHAA